MDYPFNPIGNFFDLGKIGEIGLNESLMARQISRLLDIAPDDARIDTIEQFAQPRADSARCSRYQNRLHVSPDFLR